MDNDKLEKIRKTMLEGRHDIDQSEAYLIDVFRRYPEQALSIGLFIQRHCLNIPLFSDLLAYAYAVISNKALEHTIEDHSET